MAWTAGRSSSRKVRITSRSVFAISVVAVAGHCLGDNDAADQHERDGTGRADLPLVVADRALLLLDRPPRHPQADLHHDPTDERVPFLFHSFPFPRLRMA